MKNEPIEVMELNNSMKRFFQLKPGLNFLNPANDFTRHLIDGSPSIIAAGRLDDDSIEEMFRIAMPAVKKSCQDVDLDTMYAASFLVSYLNSDADEEYVEVIKSMAGEIYDRGIEYTTAVDMAMGLDALGELVYEAEYSKAMDWGKAVNNLGHVLTVLHTLSSPVPDHPKSHSQLQHFVEVIKGAGKVRPHKNAHSITHAAYAILHMGHVINTESKKQASTQKAKETRAANKAKAAEAQVAEPPATKVRRPSTRGVTTGTVKATPRVKAAEKVAEAKPPAKPKVETAKPAEKLPIRDQKAAARPVKKSFEDLILDSFHSGSYNTGKMIKYTSEDQ